MADLQARAPTPTAITLHSQSRILEISFSDGAEFKIPFELMRVYSPSAEVMGHGAGQEVLQIGKREVNVVELESVGNYAVQPLFSDGHNTGIFSWETLYGMGQNQDMLWARYLKNMADAGASRDPIPGFVNRPKSK